MFFAFLCAMAAAVAAAAATGIQKTPAFFNHWTCIGVIKNIDFTRPYKSNIGELPLVTWRGDGGSAATADGGKLYTTIDICKHMGSRLSAGEIVGCSHGDKTSVLKCPYHGLEYGANDALGETIEYQGKLFWRGVAAAAAAAGGLPPAVPFYNNAEFRTTVLEYTMDASLYDSAYNTMDILHPEFVHNRGGIGFGSSVPPSGLRILHPDENSVAMMFGYKSNRVVRGAGAGAGAEAGGRSTENYHVFQYPGFTWSRVSFERKNHIIIAVHFCPVAPKKTKWYVTLCHNYQTSPIGHEFVKTMARIILGQDKGQMENQAPENALKKELLFKHTFPGEDAILWLEREFRERGYVYPDAEYAAKYLREQKRFN